jgi:thymidylate synthase (FAD)
MQANLIWVTPNAEDLITYMARVSNPDNQSNTQTSAKLIRYLIDHHHWSPFEMASMCVEITTTRSISAQILRHRSFSFQEFSQRYQDTRKLPPAKPPSLRRQDPRNRQNSIDDFSFIETSANQALIQDLYKQASQVYSKLLEAGVAKECARDVLPMGTPTRMYMSGTIRSWLHYLDIRCRPETQKEHRDIALSIQQTMKRLLPNVSRAMWASEGL